jgi:hypothetical protein
MAKEVSILFVPGSKVLRGYARPPAEKTRISTLAGAGVAGLETEIKIKKSLTFF